ncbi:collectrin [Polypterus senegalus]|uniref:collectrin n=1 Tax=Polypterus senegalus TaxID=55291 RepID=UPI00196630C5|nr:collectrin [Polypterus senegalus]
MLSGVILIVMLFPALVLTMCEPGTHDDGYKVRLSIKTALGKDAYQWNEDEKFLFRATIAFAMRAYTKDETYNVSSVLICNETQRVSFWIVVKSPNTAKLVQQDLLEKAIISSRNRINSAFLLSDKTLEFVGITSTLPSPIEPSYPVWLVVFGVVIGIVTLGIIAIIVSGVLAKKRKIKEIEDGEELEKEDKIVENGIYCGVLEIKEGVNNGAFAHEDDRLTKL